MKVRSVWLPTFTVSYSLTAKHHMRVNTKHFSMTESEMTNFKLKVQP